MATTRVVMPQLGESVHEGTLSKWLVKHGDNVVECEPMLEVDTDKVSAEVPAPVTGVLKEILAKEGQTVQAGAEIAVVELSDGKVTATPEAPAPPSPAERGRSGGGQAVPAAAPAEASPAEQPKVEVPSPAERGRSGGGQAMPAAAPTELSSGEHRYSPAVQMVASELKVDLSKIQGTGLGGRVTKKDVQEYAA